MNFKTECSNSAYLSLAMQEIGEFLLAVVQLATMGWPPPYNLNLPKVWEIYFEVVVE